MFVLDLKVNNVPSPLLLNLSSPLPTSFCSHLYAFHSSYKLLTSFTFLTHLSHCSKQIMSILLHESSFGRMLNSLSNGQIFSCDDYGPPGVEEASGSSASIATPRAPEQAQQKVVDWSGPDDPGIPRNWPPAIKNIVMIDIMLLNFSFYTASAVFTPSIPGIEKAFNATTTEGTLGLSLFVIAYGIGPLIVSKYQAPFSPPPVFSLLTAFPALSALKSPIYWANASISSWLSCVLFVQHRYRPSQESTDNIGAAVH